MGWAKLAIAGASKCNNGPEAVLLGAVAGHFHQAAVFMGMCEDWVYGWLAELGYRTHQFTRDMELRLNEQAAVSNSMCVG